MRAAYGCYSAQVGVETIQNKMQLYGSKLRLTNLIFKDIRLSDIVVNPNNDRHGPKGSESDAVQWLFDERGSHMQTLAVDIVEQERIFDAPLVKPDGEKYIVFDENRRVSCLKVLAGLVTPKGSHAAAIVKLAKESGWRSPLTVSCQVETDQNVIDTTLSRRHNGTDSGRGQLGWDPRAKANHANRTGGTNQYPIAEATELFLQRIGFPRSGAIKRSTLYRLINTKGRQARIGIALGEDGKLITTKDEASVIRVLTRIADDIVDDKLTLKHLLDVEDINSYLETLSAEGFDLSDKTSFSKTQQTSAKIYSKKNTKKRKPNKSETLIPNEHGGIVWKERQGKIKRIWTDLQFNLKFRNTELAIPTAFRTLIELSTDYAREQLKKAPNSTLRKRVKEVALELRNRGSFSSRDLDDLDRLLGDNKSHRELEALHRVIHSQTVDLSDDDQRAMWDSFEPYLLKALSL